MGRIIKSKNNYEEYKGHQPVGVSMTVPRLSMSVSEIVKRFTLTALKDMEEKSLLTYDFGPEVTEDPFKLLDRMDLSKASCIDITDVAALKDEALRQIAEFKAAQKKQEAANAEAIKAKQDAAHEKLVQEAMSRIKKESATKII